ncbi:MAG: ImmA/IrrE family metallo-endopeptidase [Salinarimonadaceae bacterium]|nr:MAG: ImmA/IrrE family metallo-endopeptidase [Salinarimonadaceae bacterium]
MPVLDPGTYENSKPVIRAAIREALSPADDVVGSIRAIMAALQKQGLTDDAQAPMAVYVSFFLEEVHAGLIDPFAQEDPRPEPVGRAPLSRKPPDLFAHADLGRHDTERALIDQLVAATRLYDTGQSVRELTDFIVRLRAFAPFNAMLLHIQKPGLTHAASAKDWWQRFGRAPTRGARPLLVLRTMGPVDFVFDILDTEGGPVPDHAFSFPTLGNLSQDRLRAILKSVARERIMLLELDAGDGRAGWIRPLTYSKSKMGKHVYELAYNRNHPAATRFVTIAHELAHLYLGHLGPDGGRRVPDRRHLPLDLREVEAETAAYLVAKRNGLTPRSESYLSRYKGAFADLDLYAITRAANAVETAMGISAQTLWNAKA